MANASPSSSDHQKLVDRLSNLPEHNLLHILSFLRSKHAVTTSVLSKRWQLLWTLVPTIDLDDPTFYLYDNGFSNNDGFSRGKIFEESVSKVLDGNKSPIIRRFCLRGKYCKTSSVDKWLAFAAERNVEELDLTFRSLRDDVLPFQSFSSPRTVAFWSATKSFKTLVVMKLTMNTQSYDDSQFVINIGENLEGYFPTLKVLHLSKVWVEGGEPSLSGIFASRFPLLEELVIDGTTFHHDINISLPKLRRFEIDCACLESLREFRLNMDAPSLQCLVLRGFGSGSGGFPDDNPHNLLDDSLSSLFPLLEELVVQTSTFPHDINISLPKLRRLEIVSGSLGPLRKCTLHIEAPCLQYLDLICFQSAGFCAEDLPNLVEANVDIVYRMHDEKHYDECGESWINLMNALINVRRLHLSRPTMLVRICQLEFDQYVWIL